MTELEKHITSLLLDNDCVIVPGFGGFMVHSIAARYDSNTGMYMPPLRTLGFHPQLTMNDSLLVQSYATCYDLSFPEALRRIDNEVYELRHRIETEGYCEIGEVGIIRLTDQGAYDFTPMSEGLVTPSLYGFDAFEIKPMNAESAEESIATDNKAEEESALPVTPSKSPVLSSDIFTDERMSTLGKDDAANEEQDDDECDDTETTLKIPMRIVRRLAAACAVLLLTIFVPQHVGDTTITRLSSCGIDADMFMRFMPQHRQGVMAQPVSPKVSADTTATPDVESAPDRAANAAGLAVAADSMERGYTVVLASRVSVVNAGRYVEKIKKQGYDQAMVFTKNGNTKVIYGKYDTAEEARSVRRRLVSNDEFKTCWVGEL